MLWNPEAAVDDFRAVARLAGTEMPEGAIQIEELPAPHRPPSGLPPGKMAVYVFANGPDVLKVGKVGAKSQARYTSQHYSPGSSRSNLAASILADQEWHGLGGSDAADIGKWIKENIDRFNFLMDERYGVPVLTLLESFLQCRLRPRYEGFRSQRL